MRFKNSRPGRGGVRRRAAALLGVCFVAVMIAFSGWSLTPLGTPPTAFAVSPITFVRPIGVGTHTGTGIVVTTLSFHPSAATTAGDSLILVVGDDSPNATVACSDFKNNTYTTDLSESGARQRVAVCAAHATLALATSDTMVISLSIAALQIAVIGAEYSGLSGAVEPSISTASRRGAVSISTNAVATGHADELLIGGVAGWHQGFSGNSISPRTNGGSGNVCSESASSTYTLVASQETNDGAIFGRAT